MACKFKNTNIIAFQRDTINEFKALPFAMDEDNLKTINSMCTAKLNSDWGKQQQLRISACIRGSNTFSLVFCIPHNNRREFHLSRSTLQVFLHTLCRRHGHASASQKVRQQRHIQQPKSWLHSIYNIYYSICAMCTIELSPIIIRLLKLNVLLVCARDLV